MGTSHPTARFSIRTNSAAEARFKSWGASRSAQEKAIRISPAIPAGKNVSRCQLPLQHWNHGSCRQQDRFPEWNAQGEKNRPTSLGRILNAEKQSLESGGSDFRIDSRRTRDRSHGKIKATRNIRHFELVFKPFRRRVPERVSRTGLCIASRFTPHFELRWSGGPDFAGRTVELRFSSLGIFLQTSSGSAYGIRTRAPALRGPCPNL